MNPIRLHRELAAQGYEVEILRVDHLSAVIQSIVFYCKRFNRDHMVAFLESLGAEVIQINEYAFNCFFKRMVCDE